MPPEKTPVAAVWLHAHVTLRLNGSDLVAMDQRCSVFLQSDPGEHHTILRFALSVVQHKGLLTRTDTVLTERFLREPSACWCLVCKRLPHCRVHLIAQICNVLLDCVVSGNWILGIPVWWSLLSEYSPPEMSGHPEDLPAFF